VKGRSRLRRETLREDAAAGLVLRVQSVPDGLATGLLAGVSPLSGLYGYLVGTMVGATAASSAFMVVQGTGAMAMVIADVPEVHGPVIILLERTRSASPCSKPTTTPCAGSPSGPARRPAYRAHRRAARDSVTASRATSFSRRIGIVRNLEMSLFLGEAPHSEVVLSGRSGGTRTCRSPISLRAISCPLAVLSTKLPQC